MRILPHTSFSEGYEPGFIPLNQEEGILEISHPAVCQLQEESKIVAETLILRATLRSIPAQHKEAQIQLISETIPLEGVFLYAGETVAPGYERDIQSSQHQAIVVEYAGVGQGL